jgi:tetratricopeptide (TPR) repeat protein
VSADGSAPWAEAGRWIGFHIRGVLRIARYRHDPDLALLRGAVGDLEVATGLMPAEDPQHGRVTALLGATRALYDIRLASDGISFVPSFSPAMRDGFGQALVAAGRVGREHPDFPGLTAQGAIALVLEALATRDMGRLDEALALFAAAYSVPTLTIRERSRLLRLHGSALLLRHKTARNGRDLSNAIDRLEEARRAVEQEDASPYASAVLETLADAYRARADARRGDVDRAVTIGLAALRENAGDMLLQYSDADALGAGRVGTVDAITMARWFLDHGRPDAAVSAIELGRGMVLYAATAGSGLADVLRQAGHDTLADEWARLGEAGSEPADDLRYRIMLAIEGSEAEARLLAAPLVADIRGALAVGAVDALIYLLPRDDDGPGTAVTIDAAGMVSRIPLPSLRAGPGACEDVVFSYAASARQFIDAAALRPRPWTERPVLISDSRTRSGRVGLPYWPNAGYSLRGGARRDDAARYRP